MLSKISSSHKLNRLTNQTRTWFVSFNLLALSWNWLITSSPCQQSEESSTTRLSGLSFSELLRSQRLTWIHTHTHTQTHTRTRTHSRPTVDMDAYSHTHTNTHKHTNTQSHKVYAHTQTHTHTRAHTHAHINRIKRMSVNEPVYTAFPVGFDMSITHRLLIWELSEKNV